MELSRRELTKQQNRRTILAAARQVFAATGYDAATVRDIIKATPLASGTFYNYFKSKDEIYRAILDDVARAIRPGLAAARREAATPEEFVTGAFRAFFTFVAAHEAEFRVVRGTHLRLDTPQVVAGFAELRAGLRGAIARGVFAPLDTGFLMAAMVGTAFEMAGRMLARPSGGSRPLDPDAAAAFAAALFLGGIPALGGKKP
jgi:AcrR family transcriptional regulator